MSSPALSLDRDTTVGAPAVTSPKLTLPGRRITILPSSIPATAATPTNSVAGPENSECTGFKDSDANGAAPPSFVITNRRAVGTWAAATVARLVAIPSAYARCELLSTPVRSRTENEVL